MGSPSRAVSTWTIDPDHSDVAFSLPYMGIGRFHARFRSYSGTIRSDEAEPARSSVAVTIPVAGLDVGNAGLRDWLLAENFFDVAHHPEITFRSTGLESVEDRRWRVVGVLTIAGRTRPTVLDTVYHGQVHHPFAERPMAAFTAKTTFARDDFGLGWNMALASGAAALGERVEATISICAFRQE